MKKIGYWIQPSPTIVYLCSMGAFRDLGAGVDVGAGFGNF